VKHLILRTLILLLAIVLVFPAAFAQGTDSGAIEGRVLIKGVREPVQNALVTIDGNENPQTTNAQGRFRFEAVPPGNHRITVKADHITTLTLEVQVVSGKTAQVKCYATRAAYLLDEVLVEGEKEPDQMTRREITKDELDGIPGANSDVFRVVQNLPGVAMSGISTEYSPEGLVIRGTSPEDSRYFFNGFDIPQLFHFGALISLINAEMVDSITYYPGGFGVKYGDAIGGTVEVKSRSPRTDRLGGAVDISNYSAYAMLEGPIGEKASGAGAVRRSTIDYILPAVIPEEQAEFTVSPRFYDYLAQFEYWPSRKNRLGLSALGTYDHTELLAETEENEPFSPDSFDIEIGWHSVILDWDLIPNERIFQSLAVQFLYLENEFNLGRDQNAEATVYYPAFLEEFSIALGRWNELRLGADAFLINYNTSGVLPLLPKEGSPTSAWTNVDSTSFEDDLQTWTLDGWIDDVMEPAEWVRLVPGVRVNYLQVVKQTTFDPRLTVKFFPTEKSAIKTSAGIYHQWPDRDEMLRKLGNTDLDAEVAYQAGLGFEYDFGQGYILDAQGYYKQLDQMISRTGSDAEVPYLNTGEGYVYGGELLARKRLTDRLFGWVSYTYSESKRKDSPDADWRYFDQDQTHNFIAVASYAFGEQRLWKLGGRWQIASGTPYTEIEHALYNTETDSYLPIYSEKINGRRAQPFHQLDLRLDKRWIFNTWTLNTYLDVQNVYWNKIPLGYKYSFDYSERKAVSYPTFIPSFGLQARF
jgi:outer membrane receptor protein involved in Fe transport